jgi:hypothetical protein
MSFSLTSLPHIHPCQHKSAGRWVEVACGSHVQFRQVHQLPDRRRDGAGYATVIQVPASPPTRPAAQFGERVAGSHTLPKEGAGDLHRGAGCSSIELADAVREGGVVLKFHAAHEQHAAREQRHCEQHAQDRRLLRGSPHVGTSSCGHPTIGSPQSDTNRRRAENV